MSAQHRVADEEVVIYHIARRDRCPDGDRLTPRMEARQIIDALDGARRARPNAPEATIAALAEQIERQRRDHIEAWEAGFDAALALVFVGAEYAGSGIARRIADSAAAVRDEQSERFALTLEETQVEGS